MASLQVKILISLTLISLFSLRATGAKTEKLNTDSTSYILLQNNYESKNQLIDSIINFSKLHLGKPYRGGGKGPNSFDCSGFTSFVFNNFGIKLGSSSSDQAEQVPRVSKEDIEPGDLVFFNGRRRGSRIGHVGLVVSKHENGDFDFIHAASSIGISITHSESDYYSRRYMGAGRATLPDSLLARFRSNKIRHSYSQPVANTSTENTNYQVSTTVVKKKVPAKYHTVKSGETLSEIAEKYGLTVSQLKKKNHLKKDFLSLKQRLKVKDEYEISVVEKTKPKVIIAADTTKTATANTVKAIAKNEVQSKHKVKKGETLFSISKEYNISVDDLKELNKLNNGKIFTGQELVIAATKDGNVKQSEIIRSEPESEKNIATATPEQKYGTHIVSKGETLQSISKTYKLTIAELKALNNLESDNILAGQKLITPENKTVKTEYTAKKKIKTHTVKSGETLSEIAERYNCTVSELKKWNGKKNTKLSLGEKLKIII